MSGALIARAAVMSHEGLLGVLVSKGMADKMRT